MEDERAKRIGDAITAAFVTIPKELWYACEHSCLVSVGMPKLAYEVIDKAAQTLEENTANLESFIISSLLTFGLAEWCKTRLRDGQLSNTTPLMIDLANFVNERLKEEGHEQENDVICGWPCSRCFGSFRQGSRLGRGLHSVRVFL